jgi:hypothetical protein
MEEIVWRLDGVMSGTCLIKTYHRNSYTKKSTRDKGDDTDSGDGTVQGQEALLCHIG